MVCAPWSKRTFTVWRICEALVIILYSLGMPLFPQPFSNLWLCGEMSWTLVEKQQEDCKYFCPTVKPLIGWPMKYWINYYLQKSHFTDTSTYWLPPFPSSPSPESKARRNHMEAPRRDKIQRTLHKGFSFLGGNAPCWPQYCTSPTICMAVQKTSWGNWSIWKITKGIGSMWAETCGWNWWCGTNAA